MSAGLISNVTDAVEEERKLWQNRPLDALYPIIYLTIANIAKKWTIPIKDWKAVLNRFAIEFADRFPL